MAPNRQASGMRGVYLAAAELAARGFIVSPTSRSAFGADLLVTDAGCNHAFSVQVKTNTTTFGFWLLNEKSRHLSSPTHLYVLINLRKNAPAPEYFIVPSQVLSNRVKVEKVKSGTFYSFANDDVAKKYQDRWDLFE